MLQLSVVVVLWFGSFSILLINFHFKRDKADMAHGPQRCLGKKLLFKKLGHLIVTDDACHPWSQEGLQLHFQKKWEFPEWPWWLLYHEIFSFMVL